tara:strand:+ start:322 stop:1371 length:1050 start_codon:yes stop_codon:yes gene_type:complete
VKLIIKKSLIIVLFIVFLFTVNNSYSKAKSTEDYGILSIMYHRFEENKYPSTNIKIKDFKSHINFIEENKYKFISHKQFQTSINQKNLEKKILLTIDDGFSSFYKNAWPILKEKKIPFIIFINTETVGSKGYMSWAQIKEISQFDFVHIGNHSHSHEYLVDWSDNEIEEDLKTSIKIFKEKLNHETKFFAYPFGEYKNSYKKIVKKLGFEFGFGQHSGVMDKTKDKFELPRFPINEKYGEEKRFKSILKTIPFPYLKITPEEKYLNPKNNPPNVSITFIKNGPNFKNITCYSNEENRWRKSKIEFVNDNQLNIILEGKFTTERGRINCSLRENTGEWRWLGIQFVISNL